MSFFICPRWRRERPDSPSGAGSYYQAQPEVSFARHGQGVLSEAVMLAGSALMQNTRASDFICQ